MGKSNSWSELFGDAVPLPWKPSPQPTHTGTVKGGNVKIWQR